jgi:uncharacterized protein with PIN domain
MIGGRCSVCGERFLKDKQLKWLREKVDDRRRLDHLLTYCPNCRQEGRGLVQR